MDLLFPLIFLLHHKQTAAYAFPAPSFTADDREGSYYERPGSPSSPGSLLTDLVVNMYLRMVLCVAVPGCLMLTLEVLRLGSIVVQVLHLLAVALSHYLGSLRPLHYSTTATPAALRITLAAVWMLPREYPW